jgi:hypothetical protein
MEEGCMYQGLPWALQWGPNWFEQGLGFAQTNLVLNVGFDERLTYEFNA